MRLYGVGRALAGLVGIAMATGLLVACGDGGDGKTRPGQAVQAGESRPITPPPFDLGVGPAFARQGKNLVAVEAVRESGVPASGRAARFDSATGRWVELPKPPRLQQASAQGAADGPVHLIGLECESGTCDTGQPKIASLIAEEWTTRDLTSAGKPVKADDFGVAPVGELDGRAVFELVLGASVQIAVVGATGGVEFLSDPIDDLYGVCLVGGTYFGLVRTDAAGAEDPNARLTNSRLVALDIASGDKAAKPVTGSELARIQPGDDEVRPVCLSDAIGVVMNGAAWTWDPTAGGWSKTIESGVPQPPYWDRTKTSDGKTFVLTSTEVIRLERGRAPEKHPAPPTQARGRGGAQRDLVDMPDALYVYEHDSEGEAPGRFMVAEGAR